MPPEGPRHAVITPDDHGALLAMTSWFLACTVVLCTATRLAVRYISRNIAGLDDLVVVIAACFVIGSTVTISLAVNHGFGRRSQLLDASEVTHIEKEIYATTLLYVLTVGTSKISMSFFLARLACETSHRVAVTLLSATVVLWTLAGMLGVAFACSLPTPWNFMDVKCISMETFWISVSVVDMVSDAAMILLPIHIIWDLQHLGLRQKFVVCFIFATRLILIVVSVLRLKYLPDMFSSADPLFDGISYSIATQCHLALSVIIACTPALKPFMESVQSGMLNISLSQHTHGTTFGGNSYNLHPLSKDSKTGSQVQEIVAASDSATQTAISSFAARNSGEGSIYVQNAAGRIVRLTPTDTECAHCSGAPKPITSSSQAPFRSRPFQRSHSPDLSLCPHTEDDSSSVESDIVMTRFSEESSESQRRITRQSPTVNMRKLHNRDSEPHGLETMWSATDDAWLRRS